jgi:hypothetical protein
MFFFWPAVESCRQNFPENGGRGMKKILLVGDDYIDSKVMVEGFGPFEEYGYQLVAYD